MLNIYAIKRTRLHTKGVYPRCPGKQTADTTLVPRVLYTAQQRGLRESMGNFGQSL